MVENPLICLLVGLGAFITGEERRFRPMIVGGIAAAGLGIVSFVLQGEVWSYQMLCIVVCAVCALIIPGHLYENKVKDGI